MRKNKTILLVKSMLIVLCCGISASAQGEVVSLPSREVRQQLIERLFPKFIDGIDRQNHAYVLEVKVLPSFGAPSQVSVVKTYDGALTVRKFYLANQQDMITDQLAELGDPVTTMSVEELIKRLDVRSQQFHPKPNISRLVEQFFVTPIRIRLDTSVSLDGVEYEVRYRDRNQLLHLALVGGERREKGEAAIVTWARDLIRTIK